MATGSSQTEMSTHNNHLKVNSRNSVQKEREQGKSEGRRATHREISLKKKISYLMHSNEKAQRRGGEQKSSEASRNRSTPFAAAPGWTLSCY